MPVMRVLLAMAALVSQLTLGSLVLPDDRTTGSGAELAAVTVLCRSAPAGHAAPVHPHPAGHTVCLCDLALELCAFILMPAAVLPMPAILVGMTRLVLPPARAPPAAFAWALHARAPPCLL